MENYQTKGAWDDTGSHPLDNNLTRQPAFPRVRLRIPVQVSLADGKVVCARIYNLSPDGIQIRCTPETASLIHPSGKSVTNGTGEKLMVALRLKNSTNIRTHTLNCQVDYVLPEGADEVIIGLQFDELEQSQRQVIDAALSASLELK